MAEDKVFDCSGCGSSVYQESIDSGIAKYEGAKLYCPHCLKERGSSDAGGDLTGTYFRECESITGQYDLVSDQGGTGFDWPSTASVS